MTVSRRLGIGTLLVLGCLAPGCGNDKFPQANHEVKIYDTSFVPNYIEIGAGSTVRWVTITQADRTVTSGTPEDTTTAGDLFDEILQGRQTGETEGEDFIYRFDERGTFPYFSRLPDTLSLKGTVVVR